MTIISVEEFCECIMEANFDKKVIKIHIRNNECKLSIPVDGLEALSTKEVIALEGLDEFMLNIERCKVIRISKDKIEPYCDQLTIEALENVYRFDMLEIGEKVS